MNAIDKRIFRALKWYRSDDCGRRSITPAEWRWFDAHYPADSEASPPQETS